jgi:hypothetical protein
LPDVEARSVHTRKRDKRDLAEPDIVETDNGKAIRDRVAKAVASLEDPESEVVRGRENRGRRIL